nr:protein detoxification 19 [Quercus suber]
MSPKTSSDSAAPSLEASDHHHNEEEETNRGCCKNVLDVVEAKTQLLFSLPMILTNVFCYLITLISVMFAAHLGKLELASATLASSWASVTGLSVVISVASSPNFVSFTRTEDEKRFSVLQFLSFEARSSAQNTARPREKGG